MPLSLWARRAALAVLAAGVVAGASFLWRRYQIDPSIYVQRDELVIYLLGGSTAAGEPYTEYTDLGQIVRWMFAGELGGRRIRVKNLGRSGRAAPSVVDDAKTIARALVKRPPPPQSAVAFLYPGNNEFLRFDRDHDLTKGTRPLFDEPTTSAAEKEQTL
ncbi:MAG TPA: hypothetical protein VMT89_15235, partial [Candidatus Acidoferrales bacterium]|nr:hypothetical protein [Candidatus Acidoferrales bacterium]